MTDRQIRKHKSTHTSRMTNPATHFDKVIGRDRHVQTNKSWSSTRDPSSSHPTQHSSGTARFIQAVINAKHVQQTLTCIQPLYSVYSGLYRTQCAQYAVYASTLYKQDLHILKTQKQLQGSQEQDSGSSQLHRFVGVLEGCSLKEERKNSNWDFYSSLEPITQPDT